MVYDCQNERKMSFCSWNFKHLNSLIRIIQPSTCHPLPLHFARCGKVDSLFLRWWFARERTMYEPCTNHERSMYVRRAVNVSVVAVALLAVYMLRGNYSWFVDINGYIFFTILQPMVFHIHDPAKNAFLREIFLRRKLISQILCLPLPCHVRFCLSWNAALR